MGSNEQRLVGGQMLRDMLVVAAVLHGAVGTTGVVFRAATSVYLWELVGAGVALAGLTLFHRLDVDRRTRVVWLPICYCCVRWTFVWLGGTPEDAYVGTVSMLMYLPFLVSTSMLTTATAPLWLGVSLPLGLVASIGSQRSDFAGTLLDEWRVGAAFVGVILLLVSFFRRWNSNFNALEVSRARTVNLDAKLQRQASEQLEQRMESIGRLSGNVLHEIKNLLAVVQPLADILASELPEGDQRDDARCILEASYGLQAMCESLDRLTQTVDGGSEPCDLTEVVRQSRREWRELAGPDIAVEVICDAEETWTVGPRLGFKRVITELVSNALEACSPGDSVRIALGEDPPPEDSDRRASRIVITVTDTGSGIPRRLQSQVLDPYVTTREGPRRGLGLTATYAFVQRVGGDLEVRSREGYGTEVSIWFPRRQPALAPAAENSPMDRTAETHPHLSVLVVDDQPAVLRATERALRKHGFRVTGTTSPFRALELLAEESFDVSVCDVRMPELSGPDLMLQARQNGIDVPYLFLTGHVDDETGERIDAPAERVITKPVLPATLAFRIRTLVDSESAAPRNVTGDTVGDL